MNKLNEFLNKTLETEDYDYVVASDTDSVYLRLSNLVDRVLPSLQRQNRRLSRQEFGKIIIPFIEKQYE